MSQKVESIIQYDGGTQDVWNNTTIPIPADVLVMTTDTKVVKIGNGLDAFVDLPTFFTLDSLEASTAFADMFPDLIISEANKIVAVNDSGSAYTFVDLNVSDLAPTTEAESEIANKSDSDHRHGDTYYTEAEINQLLTDNEVTKNDENILSYLLLRELFLTNELSTTVENGFIDEFLTFDNIDAGNSSGLAYVDDTIVNATGEALVVQFNPQLVGYEPVEISTYLRLTEPASGYSAITMEVSRDGGVTWTAVELSKSPMSNGSISIIIGTTDISEQPAGSTMVWRISCDEDMVLNGIRLKW